MSMTKIIPAAAKLPNVDCTTFRIPKKTIDKDAEYAKGFSNTCKKHDIDSQMLCQMDPLTIYS